MRGNSGAAPLKVLDEKGLATGGKRWRFIPPSKRLDHTSARPAALPSLDFDSNLTEIAPDDTSFSHFENTLSTEADSNITATYKKYHQNVAQISVSLPLVYRNRKKLFDETLSALEESTRNRAEATSSISRCLAALSRDLGPHMFYPFFRQVVKAIAHVFTTDREKGCSSRSSTPRLREESIMWDPETSIVPLFATLAEITRILLNQLVRDPQRTCKDLVPLLANQNRRVREMTAEACVGYIIRKTRDSSPLKRVSDALMEGAKLESASDMHEGHLVDGLGVSLFESLRVPHGRLQSRALEVVKYAIRSLGATNGDSQEYLENENRLLSVLSRCFQGIARHLTDEQDFRALCNLLVAEGEVAMRTKNSWRSGGVLFLLRNWMRSAGLSFNASIGRQGVCGVSSFLSECLATFSNDVRVVYEGFGAVLFLSLNDSSEYRQEAHRKISSVLDIASKFFGRNGLLAVLSAMLLTTKIELTALPVPLPLLLKSLSRLYERLTQLCKSSDPELPLLASVLLFRRMRKLGCEELPLSDFRVPTLDSLVKNMLASLDGKHEKGCKERGEAFDAVARRDILVEYLSNMRVAGIDGLFSNLLDARETWTSRTFPAVLTAFCYNFREETDNAHNSSGASPDLRNRIASLVKDALFSASDHPAALQDALLNHVHAFPLTVKEWLSEDQHKTDALFSRLSEGLSSPLIDVRRNSASLLSSLYSVLSHNPRRGLSRSISSVEDIVRQLRLSSELAFVGRYQVLYSAFMLLLSVPRSLEAIAGHERVLRELVRASCTEKIQRNMVETLIKFSIGLLRTPLSVLWDGARALWCAMANSDCASAMQSALKYLEECETRLLVGIKDMSSDEDDLIAGTEMSPAEENQVDSKRENSPLPCSSGTQIFRLSESENLSVSKFSSSYHYDSQGLEWDHREWRSNDLAQAHKGQIEFQRRCNEKEEALDSVTSLVQVLRVLSEEPQHTLRYRSKIIRSFLALNSSARDGKGASHALCTFTVLLERMGGLKCCETDMDLERKMRNCLHFNLTKTHAPLQIATIKCLCVSRSPFLKPHRDSFVRLLSDKTFREELTVLTESLFKRHEVSLAAAKFSEKETSVCDALTRISFSKIRGRQNKLDSKRSAVLSFLVAKCPWQLVMPMITSLALAPIEAKICSIVRNENLDIFATNEGSCSFPSPYVQKGILFSIGAIVKHCKRAIPENSWRRLGLGTVLLLQNSSRGSTGQAVRSQALVILADMLRLRSSDSTVLVTEVFRAVQTSEFDRSEYTGIMGVPALMHYVDAVMSSVSAESKRLTLKEHPWALEYCVQAMKNAAAGWKAVTISLSVGQGLAEFLHEVSDSGDAVAPSGDLEYITDLLDFTCVAIRDFFSWIPECLMRKKASEKMWSPIFAKALTLTSILANLPMSHFKALYPLADGLCTFLETGIGAADSRSKAIIAIESIISKTARAGFISGSKEIRMVETLVVRLLPFLNMRDITDDPQAISSLCRIVSQSPSADIAAVGTVLEGVNAFDASKLNEPDFDRRIESLRIIIGRVKTALSDVDKGKDGNFGEISLPRRHDELHNHAKVSCGPQAFSALLYGCLSAVRNEDTAVRGTAGYSLSLMAKWVAHSNEGSRAFCRTRMFKLLVSTVAACKSMATRREFCRPLGDLVRRGSCSPCSFSDSEETDEFEWNAEAMFTTMAGLVNSNDLDADFFENVVHLQPHRRGRALRQLTKHMKELASAWSKQKDIQRKAVESLAYSFALPLGLNITLEKPGSTEPRSPHFQKHTESREGAQKDVLNWAVELVGASASFLPWASYRSFLLILFRRLKGDGDRENVNMLLKLLVSTSKVFPRPGDAHSPPLEESTDFLTNKLIPEMLSRINPSTVEGGIQRENTMALRPSKTTRKEKDAVVFRAPIAVAAGELMTCLPSQYLDSHISLLIAPLTGALRSRVMGPREEAKKALAAVVLIFGPKYLNYVLSQILNALKDGYRRDACVYVIYGVLIGIHDFCGGTPERAPERKSFSVDSACTLLVSFLAEELEGGLGESKHDFADPNTSSERERQASRRALKAFECVELLAEQVSFVDTAAVLINPFLYRYKSATSAKLAKKLRSALKHLVQGFSRNHSMKAEDALKLCYAYANCDGMEEANQREKVDGPVEIDWRTCNGSESFNFGLQLLNVVISQNIETMNRTDERGRTLQSMCEPFLPLVARALTVGNDELTLTAFQSCQKVLKLPLHCRAQVANRLSETIVDVLAARSGGVSSHGNGSSSDDLFNVCLRAGAVLLDEVGARGFEVVSKERVVALVNISCNCIEHGTVESRSAALALLRAVVSRRLIMPCVYDAMEKVKEMGIHSHSASLRRSCISLSVGFLVSFPLGSKRVRQNLEFFVRNLNYSSANGRIAALQALDMIITKFGCEALRSESEYLFVALTGAGAGDTDGECRSGAIECLKKLFQKWGSGRETGELVRMGAMLAGVRLSTNEVDEETKFCGGTDRVVQRAGIVGLTAASLSGQLKNKELKMIGRVAIMVLKEAGRDCRWETKYSVLRCIEACFGSQKDGKHSLEVEEKMFWLWEETAELLLDKHEWVRRSACRLVGCHLSAVAIAGKEVDVSKWKTQKGWMWSRDDVVRSTMKNLCVELEGSHVCIEVGEQAVKNLVSIAKVLRQEEDENADKISQTLHWLVRRMSGIASRGGREEQDVIRRGCGLRFLIITANLWGKWIIDKVGGLYIGAVVRCESSSPRSEMEELGRKLEETILQSMQREKYYEEYAKWMALCNIGMAKKKRKTLTCVQEGWMKGRRRKKKRGNLPNNSSHKLSHDM